MKSIVLLLAVIACCLAHGGIDYPPARVDCTANSTLADCGLTAKPCGGASAGNISTTIMAGSSVGVIFFQRIAHFNSKNTLTINLLRPDGTFIQRLDMATQTDQNDDSFITIPIVVPSGINGDATIQAIFNATSGGGTAYYSCSDIVVESPSSTTGAASSIVASFAMIAGAVAALL